MTLPGHLLIGSSVHSSNYYLILQSVAKTIECFSLFFILAPNCVSPPSSCTLTCKFVNVYTIRCRVHVYTCASLPVTSSRRVPPGWFGLLLGCVAVRCAMCMQVLEDWRYIAMVIDRLQLYIFLAVTVLGSVSILINASTFSPPSHHHHHQLLLLSQYQQPTDGGRAERLRAEMTKFVGRERRETSSVMVSGLQWTRLTAA